jgi:hypothetical protein
MSTESKNDTQPDPFFAAPNLRTLHRREADLAAGKNCSYHELIEDDALEQPRYNAETEAAMQEGRDIRAGKVQAKSYVSCQEFLDDLNAEEETTP